MPFLHAVPLKQDGSTSPDHRKCATPIPPRRREAGSSERVSAVLRRGGHRRLRQRQPRLPHGPLRALPQEDNHSRGFWQDNQYVVPGISLRDRDYIVGDEIFRDPGRITFGLNGTYTVYEGDSPGGLHDATFDLLSSLLPETKGIYRRQ